VAAREDLCTSKEASYAGERQRKSVAEPAPNIGLQATASSLRSCVAAASRGA
jgi:hypothetical protein